MGQDYGSGLWDRIMGQDYGTGLWVRIMGTGTPVKWLGSGTVVLSWELGGADNCSIGSGRTGFVIAKWINSV